jgi:apolipoprotein N-acyltransferase
VGSRVRSGGVPGERTGSPAASVRAAGTLALLSTGLALAGNLVLSAAGGAGSRAAGTAVVAAVQGDVPRSRDLPGLLRATTVTANHAAATIELARQVRAGRPAPDVVIWPENSTDIDPAYSPYTYATISRAVAAIGRPVLVGAVLVNPLRNAGQLWLPGRGPAASYVKRQLVPFGEVIPFRSLLSHITALTALQPHDFTAGRRAVVFRIGRVRLGDLICYEVGFDSLVRSEALAGANLLAVQTNDADFELDGQLGETLQQLDMSRIDAITTGRSVAVASTTGVSAIIGPDGAVLARSSTWRRSVLELRVPLRSGLTLAVRAGPWPEVLISAATAIALGWAIAAGLVARRRT